MLLDPEDNRRAGRHPNPIVFGGRSCCLLLLIQATLGGLLSADEFPGLLSNRLSIQRQANASSPVDSQSSSLNRLTGPDQIWNLNRDDSQSARLAQILRVSQSGSDPNGMSRTENDGEIDIDSPGLDMGDYPNSAYTLRKGRTQFEFGAASFRTQNANNSSAYATPFLLRYGLTDDVELRLLGTGLTSLISPNEVTGFGVLTFDTKIHLWNADMARFVPAVSFEASIQSQIGSPAFRAGIEPGLFINMDFPFTEKTNFEATLGFTGNQTSISLINFAPGNGTSSSGVAQVATPVSLNENIYAASFQWALEQEITDDFSMFVHGFFARPVSELNVNAVVTGVGFFYKVSKQWMLFGSANAGLTGIPAPFLTQLGIGTQF